MGSASVRDGSSWSGCGFGPQNCSRHRGLIDSIPRMWYRVFAGTHFLILSRLVTKTRYFGKLTILLCLKLPFTTLLHSSQRHPSTDSGRNGVEEVRQIAGFSIFRCRKDQYGFTAVLLLRELHILDRKLILPFQVRNCRSKLASSGILLKRFWSKWEKNSEASCCWQNWIRAISSGLAFKHPRT